MLSRRNLTLSVAALSSFGLSRESMASTSDRLRIVGAGSTFAQPLYNGWANLVANQGIVVEYHGIGSGGGQQAISRREVDFGASDAPVAVSRLADLKLLQFPVVAGGVVPVVNIPGISSADPNAPQVRLTSDILAGIFMGAITRWDASQIKAVNPNLKMPSIPIYPAYRADASGTSAIFTDYLARVSPDWKSHVSSGSSVVWPVGLSVKGAVGMENILKNQIGAIGYTDASHAIDKKIPMASLRNAAGDFVLPTDTSFSAAVAAADWNVPGLAPNMNNLEAPNVWPIVSATYALVATNPTNATQLAAVQAFFRAGFEQGDAIASKLNYVPLPRVAKIAGFARLIDIRV